MEIVMVKNPCIRLKGKRAALLLDPIGITTKTPADAVLSLEKNAPLSLEKVEGNRLLISGPGEYEIGGIKVSGIGSSDEFVYNTTIDGVNLLIGKAPIVEKLQDKIKESHAVLLFVDSEVKPGLIPSLEASVVVLYGEKAKETAKALGKDVSATAKITVTVDKLPAETEVVVLE